MAIAYALAGLLCFVLFFLVITIPFGIAAFRIAGYVLWPFGCTIDRRPVAGVASLIGNIIWVILFRWELAIGHLVTGGPAVPDDHRHPAGARQLQDHPYLPPAAGGTDSPVR